mmetsp:Transcript_28319/g.76285  ORF Transcript_28319/g.76285 Transcript_28319/m.76285 type:complete len:128 (-) Transcript_28319:258-641(-)
MTHHGNSPLLTLGKPPQALQPALAHAGRSLKLGGPTRVYCGDAREIHAWKLALQFIPRTPLPILEVSIPLPQWLKADKRIGNLVRGSKADDRSLDGSAEWADYNELHIRCKFVSRHALARLEGLLTP